MGRVSEIARRKPEPVEGRIVTQDEAAKACAEGPEAVPLMESVTWDGKTLTYKTNREWR